MSDRGRSILGLSAAVYFPLGLLGVGWASWRAGGLPLSHPDPWVPLDPWIAHPASAGLGLTLAMLTVLATRRWTRTTRWARELHLSFREILGALPRATVLGLALLSGIGEEAFFRLGMQPTLGFVLTSLIFGVVHVGPSKRFLPWTIWAVVMGFLLGAMYEATGSLVGPVLAHVAINYANLRHIVEHDPRDPAERPPAGPPLVARSERR